MCYSSRARRWRRLRFLAAVAIAFCLDSRPAFAQSIFTVAGGRFIRDDVPATLTSLPWPDDVAVDSSGNLYIADTGNNRIRRVDASTGIITTVAGNGDGGFSGDGGRATEASLYGPGSVAVDGVGNLYIADSANNRIRRVDGSTGIITTVAGNGEVVGFSGDGGAATEASLHPSDVELDGVGNLYITDRGNSRIRRVDGSTGIITTVAGNGQVGSGGDGGAATEASLDLPRASALDGAGNLYIAHANRIRRVDGSTGIITTVAGGFSQGFSGDGGLATNALLYRPMGLALDEAGNLYIADTENSRIRRVDGLTGIITTVAGSDRYGFSGDQGPATEASLRYPQDVAVDGAGNLYIADGATRRVRRVDGSTGIITTVAGNGEVGFFGGDGGPATEAAMHVPEDVAVEEAENLYIADYFNGRIRRVDGTTGIITTVAGSDRHGTSGDGGPATEAAVEEPLGVAVDEAGNLYIAHANRIRRVDESTGVITRVAGGGGLFGDGGPAIEANLVRPEGVALDGAANLYIADPLSNRIRRVDGTTGIITTVAGNGKKGLSGDGGPATEASLNLPRGVALDGLGNLYIADYSNDRIRRVDTTGIITTVIGSGGPTIGDFGDGGPASEASLSLPEDVAVDGAGNLYIADEGNNRIRRVDGRTGIITTVAGKGEGGFGGDGGPAREATLRDPQGVAVDEVGNLYIVDSSNERIRAVYACVAIGIPVLETPSNGSSGLSLSPSLSWNPVEGAFRYDVYLDRASPTQRIVASNIETTSLSLSGLEPLTTYYWKVVAKGDPYCDPFRTAESEVWSFTTTSSCEVPEPAAP